MSTLTLRISDAVASAKITLAAALDDKITPVLTCASWEQEAQVLVSTDRYSAVTYHLPESKYEHDDEGMHIPRELLLWVSKQKQDYDRHIRYSMQERTVTAELINSQNVVFGTSVSPRVEGNFPPIYRLVRDFKPSDLDQPLALSPELLKRLLTPIVPLTKKEPVRFEFSANEYSRKPGPVLMSWGPVKILVQPNYLKD